MRLWLEALKVVLSLAAGYLNLLQTRKLIAAGEAQAIARALRDAGEAISQARLARDRVRDQLAADSKRLRQPDEFTRED